jgi:cell fate (sporulation/competence/biofilm development) regulator YlbF (YheA/YmcA/DUF963 family)
MSDLTRDTTTDVSQALQMLASTLRNTPAFISFERAASNLQNDVEAQNAISAYQSRQQSLRALIMLNALSAEDREELEQLEGTVYTNQTVSAYLEAQNALVALCCAVNDRISDAVGMRFAIRQGGCCG